MDRQFGEVRKEHARTTRWIIGLFLAYGLTVIGMPGLDGRRLLAQPARIAIAGDRMPALRRLRQCKAARDSAVTGSSI